MEAGMPEQELLEEYASAQADVMDSVQSEIDGILSNSVGPQTLSEHWEAFTSAINFEEPFVRGKLVDNRRTDPPDLTLTLTQRQPLNPRAPFPSLPFPSRPLRLARGGAGARGAPPARVPRAGDALRPDLRARGRRRAGEPLGSGELAQLRDAELLRRARRLHGAHVLRAAAAHRVRAAPGLPLRGVLAAHQGEARGAAAKGRRPRRRRRRGRGRGQGRQAQEEKGRLSTHS
mmetsp:Transcript_25065/g.78594  ORF Transcript_25065/g.78594 Transcript_25065/m.78594 type:complete len:232 (-) Transcript_25065:31-726(-)